MKKSNIQNEHILPIGNFTVTEKLLYKMISSKVTSRKLKSGELRNAIKINLMNCIKHKRLNSLVPTTSILEGFVYIVSNPQFPGLYKIGRCLDVHERILSYQTYCPYRLFKRECYIAAYDMREVEDLFKHNFAKFNTKGEWFNAPLVDLKEFLYSKEIKIRM